MACRVQDKTSSAALGLRVEDAVGGMAVALTIMLNEAMLRF